MATTNTHSNYYVPERDLSLVCNSPNTPSSQLDLNPNKTTTPSTQSQSPETGFFPNPDNPNSNLSSTKSSSPTQLAACSSYSKSPAPRPSPRRTIAIKPSNLQIVWKTENPTLVCSLKESSCAGDR